MTDNRRKNQFLFFPYPRNYVGITDPSNRIIIIRYTKQKATIRMHNAIVQPNTILATITPSRPQLSIRRPSRRESRPSRVYKLPLEQAARCLVEEDVGVAVEPGEELVHQVGGFVF